MKSRTHVFGALIATSVLGLTFLLVPIVCADYKPTHGAVKPVPRGSNWTQRHEGFVALAKKGDADVVFLGDSITDDWRGKGQEVWKKVFEPMKAVNFGIGGDQTQHVLWRIQNGELDGIKPRVAVLMIGTNNMSAHSAEEIADGIKAIVQEIQQKTPETKVLLLGIFPRSPKPGDKVRDKIKTVNKTIAKLDDRKQVRYLDIGDKFLDETGNLPKEIMHDYLHLTPKGYEIEAEAILPVIKELMK